MPRQKRTYTPRTTLFIVIGLVIIVGSYFMTPGRPVPKPEQDRVEAVVAVEPAERTTPDFAPPRDLMVEAPDETPFYEDVIPDPVEPSEPTPAPVTPLPAGVKGRVVIIIDDMGMDRKHTSAVMDLPAPVTLAFLPYAGDLAAQVGRGVSKGHELMVHVPMEPINDKLNGGPAVLRVDQTAEEFSKILNDDLSAFSGYVGINNHMGSKLTQDRAAMARVMTELKTRNLYFIDSRTINDSVAADEARKAGVPFAVRDVFLDHEETYEFAAGSLSEVERKALKNGVAIAIGHPKENTIRALREWLPTLESKGLQLVPASAVVRR